MYSNCFFSWASRDFSAPHDPVALLVNANNPQATKRYIDETNTAATGLGLHVQPVEVQSLTDFDQAFDRIVEGRLEGVAVPADPLFYQGRSLMAQTAITDVYHDIHSWCIAANRWKRAPSCLMEQISAEPFAAPQSMSTKILKGEKPADLFPSNSRPNFNSSLTTRLRKQSDTRFRSSLLLRADEVIE